MRLNESEKETILEIFQGLDPAAEVYVFGSRTDDALRGGDIDLLVISEAIGFSARITALALLKEKLGDQKIDLLVSPREGATADPFVASVLAKAVRLRS